MTAVAEDRLDVAELGRLLHAAEPTALLVPARLLRRVLKHERKLTGLGLQVPHPHCYVLPRENLLALTTRAELGVDADRELPDHVILIAQPEPEKLANLSRGQALLACWRVLFHARVHRTHSLPDALLRQRIHEIGQTEFDEIRVVLRQEKCLLPPRDDRTVYEEFAALFLELRYFAAPLLPRYFPTLGDGDRIERILTRDVDAAGLFAATRLVGAPDPVFHEDHLARAAEPALAATGQTTLTHTPSASTYRALLARAEQAAARGNLVRSALCRAEAARAAPPELSAEVRTRADGELQRLVERLQRALHLSDADAATWRAALPALLPRAAQGLWPAEARLLYDLQKVCVDHERTVYAPDLVEWAYTLFREPLVRPLPHQSFVLTVKHLRNARTLLATARLTDAERQALACLLDAALHHAEERSRDHFRPLLHDALREVGLLPENYPERVARDKLVEELLDRISERGFLNLGDLRDAVARNPLKLPDVAGPSELVAGDALLKANRLLAVQAPGVYRRAEVYLRLLQRGSALAFGTRLGRLITRYLALPFGAAVGTLYFVLEIVHLVEKGLHKLTTLGEDTHEAVAAASHAAPSLLPPGIGPTAFAISVGVLGFLFLLLLNVAGFRNALLRGCHLVSEMARMVLFDWPAAFLRLPWVRRLLDSRPLLYFARYVLKPAPLGLMTWAGLWAGGVGPLIALTGGGAVFLATSLLLNSRLGRNAEEITTDWLARKWDYLQDLLPGLYRLIVDISKHVLGAIDLVLYTVDEQLRFRSGQGRLALAAKTVLRFVWFLLAYVVRFFLVVFVEPWVNPIKHFPAVTVAAKLFLPFYLDLLGPFSAPFLFLTAPVAYLIATVLIKAIPGAAGFLAWELKENWRLYRATRSVTLDPAVIGHHGETMLRLMKPGIHSGTLPKLFAKLRRAERRAHRDGHWHTARRLRAELREIEEGVQRFVERELLAFLNGSKTWASAPFTVTAVETGSNRIRVEMTCPAAGGPPLELRFEEQSGWLLSSASRPGWLEQRSERERAVLTLAVTGFLKKCGVDLTREQVQVCLRSEAMPYDIADEGLVVWPAGPDDTTVVYDLHEAPRLQPHVRAGRPQTALPVLEAQQILFGKRPVAWEDWVRLWEREQAGQKLAASLMPGMRVLPVGARVL